MHESSESEMAMARVDLIAAIWAEIESRPAETVGQTGLRAPFYERSLPGYAGRWKWTIEDLALEKVTLLSVARLRGIMASGSDHTAYDLGDDFYYVIYNEHDDSIYLDAILAKPNAEAGFEAIQREALASYVNAGGDQFYGRDWGEPWFIHTFVDAVKNSPVYPDAFHEVAEYNGMRELRYSDTYRTNLKALIRAAVINKPSLGDDSIAQGLTLADDVDESEEFERLFMECVVHWRDTGEALTLGEKTDLLEVCHYLLST
ncbi:MAG: hypothetical protein IT340_00485 [Chloroflexi bacterium]|nr:hypothetical protein [Chloroflexota bacterium]